MKKWIRNLACRWLGLTPTEDVPAPVPIEEPDAWSDLLDAKDVRIVWPRMVRSEVWQKDCEPFFKQSLLATLFQMTNETDSDKLRRLQERAKVINDWLERPKMAMRIDEAAFDNAFRSGDARRFLAEQERANAK